MTREDIVVVIGDGAADVAAEMEMRGYEPALLSSPYREALPADTLALVVVSPSEAAAARVEAHIATNEHAPVVWVGAMSPQGVESRLPMGCPADVVAKAVCDMLQSKQQDPSDARQRLPEILWALHKKQATGILTVEGKDGVFRRLYLNHGSPVFIDSPSQETSMSMLLQGMGIITPFQAARVTRSISAVEFEEAHFGAAAVEMGYASVQEIEGAFGYQQKERFKEIFHNAKKAHFRPEPVDLANPMLPSMLRVIRDGVLQVTDTRFLGRLLRTRIDLYARPSENIHSLHSLDLAEEQTRWILTLSGRYKLREYISLSPIGKAEAMQVVYLADLVGALQVQHTPFFAVPLSIL